MATELRFTMNLPRDQAERYYQGTASYVIVQADNGQKVQFPAAEIRPFIDASGVRGYFSISFDDNHKLIGIKKLSNS